MNVPVWETHNFAHAGCPFSIRADFEGPNPNNKSLVSKKFWMIERTVVDGPVHIRFGAHGTNGTVTNEGIGLDAAIDRLWDKVRKGYIVSSASYTRTSILLAPYPFCLIREIKDGVGFDENGVLVASLTRETSSNLKLVYAI